MIVVAVALVLGGFVVYWQYFAPGLLVLDVKPSGAKVEINGKEFTSSDKSIKYWFKGQADVFVTKTGFLSNSSTFDLKSLKKTTQSIQLNQMAYVGAMSDGDGGIFGRQGFFISTDPVNKSIIFLHGDNKFHKFSLETQEKTYLVANDNSQTIDIDLGIQTNETVSSIKYSPTSKKALVEIVADTERKIKLVDFDLRTVKSLSSQYKNLSWLDDQSLIALDKENNVISLNSDGDILRNFGKIDQDISTIFALSSEKIVVSKSDGSVFTYNIRNGDKKGLNLGDSIVSRVLPFSFAQNEAILIANDTVKNRNAYFFIDKDSNISNLPIFSVGNNIVFKNQDEIIAFDYLSDRSGLEFYSYNFKTKQTKILQNYKTDSPGNVREFVYNNGNLYFTDGGQLITFQINK